MKKYIALLLLALPFAGKAQNRLFVPILPNECLNCISQFSLLSKVDKDLPVTLVFPERYKSDSAALSKRMYLDEYKMDICWSDSLFSRFKNRGPISSSVNALNPESGKSISVGITSLKESMPFFNALNRTDSVELSAQAFGGETISSNTGRYLYCLNMTSKEIRAFDRTNGQHLYSLAVTDSLVQAAFRLRYPAKNWKTEYQEAKEFCTQKRHMDANVIESMYCSNDTVYAIAHFEYIIRDSAFTEKETTVFLALATYKYGKLIDFSIVENYIDPKFKGMQRGIHKVTASGVPVKHEEAYYILSKSFFFHNGKIYHELNGGYSTGIPNYVLGIFGKDAKNVYQFERFYHGTLPSEYINVGNGYVFPGWGIPYSYPYVALMLSNHFFSVDPAYPDLVLPVLPLKGDDTKGIFELKVSRDYAYVIYRNGKDNSLWYAQVDIRMKRIIQDVRLVDYNTFPYIADCIIDDFDHRFVYIPTGAQTLVRKKVLE